MSTDIVNLPGSPAAGDPPGSNGPCGPLDDEIIEAVNALQVCLSEVPCGIIDDPRAEVSEATMTELARARDLIDQACALLEGVNEREARYLYTGEPSEGGAA